MSQNLLDFEFFAFSDEGVDYGAALTASLAQSGSVDEYIRRTPLFEAGQFKDFYQSKDFQTFLYSVPAGRQTLPEFTTNFDERPDITVKRIYFIDLLILTAKTVNRVQDPVSVVVRAAVPQQTRESSLTAYALEQQIAKTTQNIVDGKNVVGQPIGRDSIMLNAQVVFNTQTGLTSPLLAFKQQQQAESEAISVKKEVEVITGLSRAKINFVLKSSEGEVVDPSGYLIEVFESGSGGEIIKLFEENVEDVLEDEILKKGFSSELFLDADATNLEIISEAQRLARQQTRNRDAELRRLQKDLQAATRK